LKKRNIWNWKM